MAFIDSSLAVMITGKAIKAKVNQPAIKETPQSKYKTNKPNPNKPKTIEGTPDKFKIDKRIDCKTFPGRLYSLK